MAEDYRYPKNWRPNWVKAREKDGRKDFYYGKKGDKDHGHTVQKGKDIEYARTPEGRVMVDNKKAKNIPSNAKDDARRALMDQMRDKRQREKQLQKQKGKGKGFEIGD